jgi:hypothetical protein
MPDAALSTTGWAWWQDETGKFELGSRRCDRECRRRQRLEASLGLSTHPTLSCWAENWERSARRMPVREFAKEAAGVRAVTTASRSSGRSRKSANATGCFTLAVFRPDLAEHSSAAQCRRQSPGRKGRSFGDDEVVPGCESADVNILIRKHDDRPVFDVHDNRGHQPGMGRTRPCRINGRGRPYLELAIIWLVPPNRWKARINMHREAFYGMIVVQHHLRRGWAPLGSKLGVDQPSAMK